MKLNLPFLMTIFIFLCLVNANANAQGSFPTFCSQHPLYATAVGSGNPTLKAQFDAAQFLIDQYEYAGKVNAAVGYKLLSTESKNKAVNYTYRGIALSPLDNYISEIHYSSTLLQGSEKQNDEAFENYMFANMLSGSFQKFKQKMQQNLGHYQSFPKIRSRVQKHLNQMPRLQQQYQPFLEDSLLAYNYFKDIPSEQSLRVIEANNARLSTAFKNKLIPTLSYPALLYFTGRGITHHKVISQQVNQTYTETLANPNIHAMSAFMLADRFYTNNKLKNNPSVVEVIDVALSRKGQLSNPQVVGLLSKKAQTLYELQSYQAYDQTLEQLKPLITTIKNPSLLMSALVILTPVRMVDNPASAENYVLQMEALLRDHSYLKNKYQVQVTTFRNGLSKVVEITPDTDTASEYFELALYKLNAMDYQGMIPLLIKAKALLDEKRKVGGEEAEKETELLYTRILTDLVGSHVKTGQAEMALMYAEMFKNKKLNSLLGGQGNEVKSVKEIQASLAADEALIYYVSTGTYDSTAFFNFLITRERVSAGFFDLTKIIGQLFQFIPQHTAHVEKGLATKELRAVRSTVRPKYDKNYSAEAGDIRIFFDLYRSYLHPQEGDEEFLKPNIFKILSNQMWENLIPNQKLLVGKKKLIISPAGDLSFIPFEVFKNTPTSRLLVEDYEISYTPSASVLVSQRAEKSKTFKKNILAFGDAKYSLRKDTSFPVKNISDITRLKLSVQNSIAKNQNIDYAYAGLQGDEAMSYLIGTKNEVEAIALLVDKTDVRMDAMMTENELKKLSNSGALNDYRVIHIASHASVNPYVFEMSSVAMSVYASPLNGEDGMITVDEMKALDMNPELVMLSACQTGLGRITTGDSVQGLNNSLLQAGADATLTSLWSVNDYATSVFVKEFYDLVFNKNVPYKEAVTQVKREFLMGKYGEQLRHPEYWAAFIYYGK